ncbi:hypothetical protein G4Y79_20865 [Phototrophicus methaneseepsis]|uniref:Phage major capsid protein n=1 Tax=Phototrophicus methaneseepsis TaxID=2710758 RepID=A0A7S8IE68_9CHLR|nr:hypothetical protein [Phototrophicus methaneseepsis]QPC82109.1 hypothetical protein G4Y79_20865 [Phototrophicus methaneseepsis]
MVQTLLIDLNSLYNKIYDDSLFVAREQTLMAELVTVKNGIGYTQRVVPIRPQATASVVADGTSFVPEAFGKNSKATLTPAEVMASHDLTWQTLTTDTEDDIAADSSMELGMAVAEKVDVDLLALLAGFSNGVGAAAASATIAMLGAAVSILTANKARGQYYGVLHPFQWHDIWLELGQPAATQAFLGDTANEAMRQYAVQMMINTMWFVSSNIGVDANDDAVGGVFIREALMLDVRDDYDLFVEDRIRTNDRKLILSGHMGYAVGEVRDEFGVSITTDATQPTS